MGRFEDEFSQWLVLKSFLLSDKNKMMIQILCENKEKYIRKNNII